VRAVAKNTHTGYESVVSADFTQYTRPMRPVPRVTGKTENSITIQWDELYNGGGGCQYGYRFKMLDNQNHAYSTQEVIG